jgi:hypothetical protein
LKIFLKKLKIEKNSDFLPFGVLRSVLAMVGVVAKVVIKVKIDIKNGFGIWLF